MATTGSLVLTPAFLVVLSSSFVATTLVFKLLSVPVVPQRDPKSLSVLDPVGGSFLKRFIAHGMCLIAQFKESRKGSIPREKLEAFHKPEDHAFFNESYYFNGCDVVTRDRVITRISRRANKGGRSYVFLLLDLKDHGILSLEADIPAEVNNDNPTALGLSYSCVIPMKLWRLKYSGLMTRGLIHPQDKDGQAAAEKALVEFDLEYSADTDEFWYMRDDHPVCLGGNLSQEPWGMDFVRVCLKRTVDHAHYEDFGRMRGHITVNGNKNPVPYDFGTFRDHSWDIRRWATMDNLFILLIALEEPLVLSGGMEYWYLDLTLVDMPGNVGGVARYSTGYALGKIGTPKLVLTAATSIRDIKALPGGPGVAKGPNERYPTAQQEVYMKCELHPRDARRGFEPCAIRIKMGGDVRRLLYWPDNGAFKVYEDCLEFHCTDEKTGKTVQGYGTRQSGFRVGEFDPSLGGCG